MSCLINSCHFIGLDKVAGRLRFAAMAKCRPVLAVGLVAAALAVSPAAMAASTDQLDQFAAWLHGDFNNHEQVWQQAIDKVEPSPHTHSVIKPVTPHGGSGRLFYFEEYDGATMQQLRSRQMLRLSQSGNSVLLRMYVPADPHRASPDTLAGWQPLTTCDTRWSRKDGAYLGTLINVAGCRTAAADAGARIPAANTGRLDSEYFEMNYEVYGNDRRPASRQHIKGRKVRWFKGWAVVRKDRIDASAGADEWVLAGGLRTHNEGHRFPLLDRDGSETGFEIQLARLTQQEAQVEVLVLKLFRKGEEAAFSYAWTAIKSERAGINLRWIQTGWTAENGGVSRPPDIQPQQDRQP